MKKYLFLASILLLAVMVTSPAVAQTTTDDVLAEAQNEAVLVISETAFNVWGTIFAGFIALVGIVTTTALMLLHRSTPQWAHMPMIAVAEKAIETLKEWAGKTTNTKDDEIVQAIETAFHAFKNIFLTVADDEDSEGDEGEPPPPTTDTPLQ